MYVDKEGKSLIIGKTWLTVQLINIVTPVLSHSNTGACRRTVASEEQWCAVRHASGDGSASWLPEGWELLPDEWLRGFRLEAASWVMLAEMMRTAKAFFVCSTDGVAKLNRKGRMMISTTARIGGVANPCHAR